MTVSNMAKKLGYKGIEKVGTYGKYDVYYLITEQSDSYAVENNGLPSYLLSNNNEVRLAEPKETDYIIAYIDI
jgi:hypothetical protein